MKRTWKPTVAGIINLVVASIAIGYLIAAAIGYGSWYSFAFLPLCVPPLAGGICALRRKVWWLALVGSFFGLFPVGLVSIILIALSKEEFT